MKPYVLVIALPLFLMSNAKAEPFKAPAVLRTENLVVLLLDEPCKDKNVLQYLEGHVHPKYKAGAVNHKEHGPRSLCYLTMDKYDSIFIIDDQFGQVEIPKGSFGPTDGKAVNLNEFKKPGQKI